VIWGKVLHGRAEGAAACGTIRNDNGCALGIADRLSCATPFWELEEHHREHPKGEWSATQDCGLTFVADSRFPQRRSESYEIKSDLPNKLMLTIMSRSDGTVFSAMMSERTPQRPVPSAEPQ
jgi:hypothetical protein